MDITTILIYLFRQRLGSRNDLNPSKKIGTFIVYMCTVSAYVAPVTADNAEASSFVEISSDGSQITIANLILNLKSAEGIAILCAICLGLLLALILVIWFVTWSMRKVGLCCCGRSRWSSDWGVDFNTNTSKSDKTGTHGILNSDNEKIADSYRGTKSSEIIKSGDLSRTAEKPPVSSQPTQWPPSPSNASPSQHGQSYMVSPPSNYSGYPNLSFGNPIAANPAHHNLLHDRGMHPSGSMPENQVAMSLGMANSGFSPSSQYANLPQQFQSYPVAATPPVMRMAHSQVRHQGVNPPSVSNLANQQISVNPNLQNQPQSNANQEPNSATLIEDAVFYSNEPPQQAALPLAAHHLIQNPGSPIAPRSAVSIQYQQPAVPAFKPPSNSDESNNMKSIEKSAKNDASGSNFDLIDSLVNQIQSGISALEKASAENGEVEKAEAREEPQIMQKNDHAVQPDIQQSSSNADAASHSNESQNEKFKPLAFEEAIIAEQTAASEQAARLATSFTDHTPLSPNVDELDESFPGSASETIYGVLVDSAAVAPIYDVPHPAEMTEIPLPPTPPPAPPEN